MKLRTELLRGPAGVNLTAGYSEGKYSAREHDAFAAHALLQAMEELQPNILCDAIQQRADELMREWTGEVAK